MDSVGSKILIHASAFFAPILVPIIFFLLSSDSHVKSLSIQALVFQGIMWVLVTISIVFSYILIGLPFLLLFSAIGIVVPVIGIVRAAQGEYWNYPIIGRFM